MVDTTALCMTHAKIAAATRVSPKVGPESPESGIRSLRAAAPTKTRAEIHSQHHPVLSRSVTSALPSGIHMVNTATSLATVQFYTLNRNPTRCNNRFTSQLG